MEKFKLAYIPTSTIKQIIKEFGITKKQAKNALARERESKIWLNDLYQVNETDIGEWIWLSIKRIDKDAIHDWRHLQEIKNMLVGKENEGVEIYPAESRLVDSANQYHLWVSKDSEYRFPWGFNERYVTDNPGANAKQRKFD